MTLNEYALAAAYAKTASDLRRAADHFERGAASLGKPQAEDSLRLGLDTLERTLMELLGWENSS